MKPSFMLPTFKYSQATSQFEEKPMNKLRRLYLALSLSVILSGTAFAGESSGPPCAIPGESSGPPCASSQFIPDETTEASLTVAGEVETIVVEATLYALESLLTLF
jgi:heme A synthase